MLQTLEHSENLQDQELCFQKSLENWNSAPPVYQGVLKLAHDAVIEHNEIIKRFGRFPHRNQVLEREFTPEEIEYMKSGPNTFGQ